MYQEQVPQWDSSVESLVASFPGAGETKIQPMGGVLVEQLEESRRLHQVCWQKEANHITTTFPFSLYLAIPVQFLGTRAYCLIRLLESQIPNG